MGHTSYEELTNRIEEARKKVVVGARYYHWKHPEVYYKILSVGFTEWAEEVVVIYQDENKMTWVRRLEGEGGWLTPVDGKSRFVRVKD